MSPCNNNFIIKQNVFFSAGASKQTHRILKEQGYKRVLILTTPRQQNTGQSMAQQLGNLAIEVYPHAVMHVPVNVAEDAIAYALKHQIDCCLALGGGSTISLAKAVICISALYGSTYSLNVLKLM